MLHDVIVGLWSQFETWIVLLTANSFYRIKHIRTEYAFMQVKAKNQVLRLILMGKKTFLYNFRFIHSTLFLKVFLRSKDSSDGWTYQQFNCIYQKVVITYAPSDTSVALEVEFNLRVQLCVDLIWETSENTLLVRFFAQSLFSTAGAIVVVTV